MKQARKFVVSQFTNPSGEKVFRLSGWLDGRRIRKNFASRTEAEAERQVFEIGSLQTAAGVRATLTRLTDEQIREAEGVFLRLKELPYPLSFCIDYTVANYRAPDRQKSLTEAVAEYIAAKDHEFDQDYISRPQMGRIRMDLKRLEEYFPGKSVADLGVPNLVSFLEVGRPGLKTYNNRRGILSTFFKFSFHRGWIAENPILKVPHHRIRRRGGRATTFSATQASELMEYFERFEGGRWIPYFALCLFAGIRPGVPDGEITKLEPEAVCLETGTISISAAVSKIREPRRIVIQPNLAAWLKAYPLKRFPIVVADFQKRRAKFSKTFRLTHDVLRHTFISMFVAKYRSLGEAALQAGNSESIIRKHYLDLKDAAEADAFFSILPKYQASLVPVQKKERSASSKSVCTVAQTEQSKAA